MKFDLYRKIFHFSLLAVIISICYSGTLDNSWHFDDFHNIVDNKKIHIDNFSWEEIQKSLYTKSGDRTTRPLAVLSFAINYLFSGLDTTSYYVVNILIHIICSIFVYLVFIITLSIYREKNETSIPDGLIQDVALLGAVFWAVHPIQTQAVTYIVQRMASMAAMFYVISLYSYLKFRLQKYKAKKILLLVLSIFFWIAGMLSKENAALLPLSIIAYEIILFQTSIKNNLKFWSLLIASVVCLSFVTLYFMSGEIIQTIDKTYTVRPYTMWERLITEPIILTRYIILLFIPVADYLTLESNILASSGLFDPPITIVSNIFIFILIFFSILFWKKFPLICYSIIFYFVNHLIESTIIGLELYFEHRNYLPSMFIYLTISYFMFVVFLFYKNKNKHVMSYMFVVFATFIILCEGNATYLRNEVWRDEISLNLDNVEKGHSSLRGYNNLAAEYIRIGEGDKALGYLKQAEQIFKKSPEKYQKNAIADIYCNAGIIQLHAKKDIEKAAQLLMKSVELDPTEFKSHFHLAIAFFKLGDIANAETAIFNAAQLKKDDANIYNLFGRILYAHGKPELAIKVLSKGLELEKRKELYFNLTGSYMAIGNYKRARSVLLSMDADDDLLYQLYILSITSALERENLIKKIAINLLTQRVDYNKWINEVSENKVPEIIYPDISNFKKNLDQAYAYEVNSLAKTID